MPYTIEDFRRDFLNERLAEMTPEEAKGILGKLSPEVRFAGLMPEEIKKALEKLKGKASAPAPAPAGKKRKRR